MMLFLVSVISNRSHLNM